METRAERCPRTGRDLPTPVAPAGCPVEDWLGFLGHRWNALILWHLQAEPRRFQSLRAQLPAIAAKVLAERLRTLVSRELVARERPAKDDAGGVEGTVRYGLTVRGRALLDVLDGLERWARTPESLGATHASAPYAAQLHPPSSIA